MTTPATKDLADRRAIPVALAAFNASEAELVILFGSRVRRDYHDKTSDIDVMLVQEQEPDPASKKAVAEVAEAAAAEAYGHPVPVELVWRTLDEFRFNRRYVNSVETNAVREGVVMPRNPEEHGSREHEDERTEYAYDCSNYNERLRHAETHLEEFIFMVEHNRSDLAIGQHAQNALEHGMKALLAAAGGQYGNTHDIGTLLNNVRHFDPEMREFRLAIPPDIYTEYEWETEYRKGRQPELTQYPDFAEKSVADIARIIDRAKMLKRLQDQDNE